MQSKHLRHWGLGSHEVPSFWSGSSPNSSETLADTVLALIVTAHPGVDHDLALQRSNLVVDLRGITRGSPAKHAVRL
jgi:hypothetical protein